MHFALVHKYYVIGQAPRLPHIMGRHHNAGALGLRLLQDRFDLAGGAAIKVGAGLVQKQDVGPVASELVLGGLHHRYYRQAA